MNLINIPGRGHLKLMFRALQYKNYRLFVGGQSLSLVGTWLQMVAMTWLVYRLTDSAFMLGLIGFAGQIPMLVVTPFAGVFADRWDRHKTLLFTQILALCQALLISVLVFTNVIQVWHLFVLSLFLGIINAFDMPVRQAFVTQMIDNHKEDIGNAVALNSSMVNAARLVGPSLAGILIATVGEGWCFLINALSFIAVVVSLLRMKITTAPKMKNGTRVLQELKEGFSYTFGFPPIRFLILMLAGVGLMSTSITLLAPVFAKEFLHGDARTFGFLMGAFGSGALLGAIYLLNKKSVLGLGKLIGYAILVFGSSLLLFGLSRVFWLSMIIMFVSGSGMMLHLASTNTLLQTISDENKRGRVMSFYAMAFRGLSPFGSLIAGSLGSTLGAPATVIISGIFIIIVALLYRQRLPQIRPLVRPIYEQLGILPPLVNAVQIATSSTAKKIVT